MLLLLLEKLRQDSAGHTNKSACARAASCKLLAQFRANKIVKQSTHFPAFPPSLCSRPLYGHVSKIANQLCWGGGEGWGAAQGHSWLLKCRCEDSLRQLIIRLVLAVVVTLLPPPIPHPTHNSHKNITLSGELCAVGEGGGRGCGRCATKGKD